MPLRLILVLSILVCGALAQQPRFLPFATILNNPGWKLSYAPLMRRSVTFEHGTLLQAGTAEDEVRLIYTVFYERRASLTRLSADLRAALIRSILPETDPGQQPLSGWHTVGLVEATHAERSEPLHWLIFVMRSGSVDFAPAVQLYEPQPESTGGSRLFQQFQGPGAERFGLSTSGEELGHELRRLSGDESQSQQR
jgi:hypothetical protein